MFYTVIVGVPYFMIFYKSKSFKYRKCAEKHLNKIIKLMVDKGISINNAFKFTKIVCSLKINPDVTLSGLYNGVFSDVR